MPFQYPTRRLSVHGQALVEVNVGPPVGYALLAEADHARIAAEATSAAAYLRAVTAAAQVTASRPFDLLDGSE